MSLAGGGLGRGRAVLQWSWHLSARCWAALHCSVRLNMLGPTRRGACARCHAGLAHLGACAPRCGGACTSRPHASRPMHRGCASGLASRCGGPACREACVRCRAGPAQSKAFGLHRGEACMPQPHALKPVRWVCASGLAFVVASSRRAAGLVLVVAPGLGVDGREGLRIVARTSRPVNGESGR